MGGVANAQSANNRTDNTNVRASDRATDAFGVRVGTEQIGLYSETQVRGLNLQVSGNYRLGGSYFVRAGALIDPLLSGVTTRVGFNALGTDFAAPTGVVEYGLRSPIDSPGTGFGVSLMPFGGNLLEATTAIAMGDKAGLLIGGQSSHQRNSSGSRGQSYRAGALGELRPVDGASILAFVTHNSFDFDGGFGATARGTELPRRIRHPNRLTPTWGTYDGKDINAGIIGRYSISPALTFNASLIYSRLELEKTTFTAFSLRRDGTGVATVTLAPPRENDAYAGALGASWRVNDRSRIYGELRLRKTYSAFAPTVSVRTDIDDQDQGLPDIPEPLLPSLPATVDETRQLIAGLGYEHSFDWLRLKGSVQRARNRRSVAIPGKDEAVVKETPLLFDFQAVAPVHKSWLAFATWTRGLEDSGIAPPNATNATEALPTVIAEQYEAGIRGKLTDGLTLISSAFSITKPAAGFNAEGAYGLFGDLTHRGAELSLTGSLTNKLRLVSGIAYLDATREGELVDLGKQMRRMPGVSKVTALANLIWTLPGVSGLSLDGQLNYSSARLIRSSDDLTAPAYATVDLGLLKTFKWGKADVSLRARVQNLFDSDAWVAQRSETLDRLPRRNFRLTLNVRRS